MELSDIDKKNIFDVSVRLRYQEIDRLRLILSRDLWIIVENYPVEIY